MEVSAEFWRGYSEHNKGFREVVLKDVEGPLKGVFYGDV